jgi:hypothetical protein
MPMSAPKLKIYGLSMTRRTYVILQLTGFIWLLALYGWWRWLKLEQHPNLLVRWFDACLLAIYLLALAETILMLRRFKRAERQQSEAKSSEPRESP